MDPANKFCGELLKLAEAFYVHSAPVRCVSSGSFYFTCTFIHMIQFRFTGTDTLGIAATGWWLYCWGHGVYQFVYVLT